MVSNTSQTYPKYLISIGIIIWNEKKEFRTLSQGDHNHWCVGKENNRPKSTLCFQHWCSTCYIKDIFLICCYFIRHRHQKSSHQARQLHQPKQSDIPKRKTLSEKNICHFKEAWGGSHCTQESHQYSLTNSISNIAFSLTIINRKHFSVWFLKKTFGLLGTYLMEHVPDESEKST